MNKSNNSSKVSMLLPCPHFPSTSISSSFTIFIYFRAIAYLFLFVGSIPLKRMISSFFCSNFPFFLPSCFYCSHSPLSPFSLSFLEDCSPFPPSVSLFPTSPTFFPHSQLPLSAIIHRRRVSLRVRQN